MQPDDLPGFVLVFTSPGDAPMIYFQFWQATDCSDQTIGVTLGDLGSVPGPESTLGRPNPTGQIDGMLLVSLAGIIDARLVAEGSP